jgi:hypothetical protein
MKTLTEIMATFTTRDIALIFWLCIALIYVLYYGKTRQSLIHVLKAFSQKIILVIFSAMMMYVFISILVLYRLEFWVITLVKDTVFWFVGTACIMLINVNKVTKDDDYFKKVVSDSIKLSLILAFIINFYTFDLWFEILLIPLLFIIGGVKVFAEKRQDFKILKKPMDSILAILGIILLLFVLNSLRTDYQRLISSENLRAFIFQPLMTLLYIPFIYLLGLFIAYQDLFVRLDIFLKRDKPLADFAKREILLLCKANLTKLTQFSKKTAKKFMTLKNKDDVISLIQEFNGKGVPT